jgi:protein-S-isoprenylcysteine O-methyltransferase Ste14
MPEKIRTGRAAALLSVGYAVAGYLLTLGVLVYTIGFLARWGVPKNIDSAAGAPWPAAVAIDAALLLLFAVQHTVMARGAVKRRSARLFGAHAERATYVVATGAVLVTLLAAWQPLPATAWRLTGPAAVTVYAVFAAGWLVALGATFMVSHTDLFGLRQAWRHARGREYEPPAFTRRGLYARVRHPLMTGFLIAFWAAPTMTAGHLLFAAAATGYIGVGIAFEERDLIAGLGDTYRAYRAEVPAVVPAVIPVLTFRKERARNQAQAAGQGHVARKEEQAA